MRSRFIDGTQLKRDTRGSLSSEKRYWWRVDMEGHTIWISQLLFAVKIVNVGKWKINKTSLCTDGCGLFPWKQESHILSSHKTTFARIFSQLHGMFVFFRSACICCAEFKINKICWHLHTSSSQKRLALNSLNFNTNRRYAAPGIYYDRKYNLKDLFQN